MSDIFREIDEEVRRDRLFRLWHRYWKIGAGVLVVILGGVVAYVILEQGAEARRQAEGAQFLAAIDDLEMGLATDSATAFAGLAAEGSEGYAALAGLRQAQALFAAGDRAGAVAVYEALSAESRVDPIYRELAALLAAQLRLDIAPRAEIEQRLAALAQEGRPWRYLARELMALAALKAGDRGAAREGYAALAEEVGVSPGLRSRATEMLTLLGPREGGDS